MWSTWRGRHRTWIFLQVLTKPEFSVPSALPLRMEAPGDLFLESSESCQHKMKAPRVSPVTEGAPSACKCENATKLHFESERTAAWHSLWGVTEQLRLMQCGTHELVLKEVICLASMWLPTCWWLLGPTSLPPSPCLSIRQLPFRRGRTPDVTKSLLKSPWCDTKSSSIADLGPWDAWL